MTVDERSRVIVQCRHELAKQVRQLRTAKALSQEQLAHQAGCDRATVGRLEAAAHGTRVDILFLIADILGVPTAALFHATDDRPPRWHGPDPRPDSPYLQPPAEPNPPTAPHLPNPTPS